MRIRYFAGIKAAAGTAEESVDAATLGAALDALRARHDDRYATVLQVCSFVVDGDPTGARDLDQVLVGPDAVVDCLPPFAGG